MVKIKTKTEQVINVSDWDDLVQETYKRPYSFQQQDGCKERQRVRITIPCEVNDFENDTVPEVVNHEDMGVSFKAWLARDPKQKLKDEKEDHQAGYVIELWWARNFYPTIEMVANDLHAKGLLEAGDYTIDIDW